MYRNILVPVSFDEDRDYERSFQVAKELAEPGAKVTLLHVMEQVPAYAINYFPEGFRAETMAAILATLSEQAITFEDGHAAVIEGHAGTSILETADDMKADCIIIASHRPGMQDYLLGSTAARVVRHAKCAVHVVR
jgi:nucleotide-binding universal stress UspA family protein